MLKSVILAAGLVVPQLALACGGAKASDQVVVDADAHREDASACAKKADLVGSNCSYTTGTMAQRVLAEGSPYAYAGTLVRAENGLGSRVAAPFVVGPDRINVIANEVFERLYADGLHEGRVQLEGKLLEVDGLSYFVLTDFSALAS